MTVAGERRRYEGFEMEPYDEEFTQFLRSAVLFIVTMGTVFGCGMLWTNYGDEIAFKWRKDWNGMKEGWAAFTSPKKRERKPSLFGQFPHGHDFDTQFKDISRQLEESYGYGDRGVVPMIDRSKPRFD